MTSHTVSNEQEKRDSSAALLLKRQKAQGRRSWSFITLDTWILEGASLIFSVACLISIYGILIAYSGKQRPSFVYNISLNAIISILATGCKSSLVFVVGEGISQLKWLWFQNRRQLSYIQTFEDASRGPLGSIALLFRHQGRSLASLGAMVLIFMLAFDPFVQQILSYPTELIVTATDTLAAGVPQVQQYNESISTTNMTSSYYLGIWDTGFDITPTCPSGNCTWPSYRSLGICSQCSDITSTSTLNCAMPNYNILDDPDFASTTCEVVPSQGYPSYTNLTVSIFNGTVNEFDFYENTVWMVEDSESLLLYSGVKNPLMVLAQSSLGFDKNLLKNTSDLAEGIFIENVTQCAFSFCVKEYSINVTSGNAVIEKSSPDFGKTENITIPYNDGNYSTLCWVSSQTPKDPAHYYGISSPEDALINVIGPEFTYCYDMKNIVVADPFIGSNVESCWQRESEWECDSYGPEALPVGNLGRILELGIDVISPRVADSMTRTFLQNSNITLPGTVYTNEVMVRVQWAWMILPTLLVILGNVFLVCTTYASRRKSIWKSSVLALLFHGLDDQVEPGDCMTGSRMEKLAEHMHVRLDPSEADGRVMLREK
ncbi:hypothetical protein N7540_000011 [Penicillium herquei]|nr:hypothetical protein N7540_000011 [Penicillium herquei]